MALVPCISWIKRGVASPNPEKVSVSKEELQRVIDENKAEVQILNPNEETSDGENDTTENQPVHTQQRGEEQIIADYNLDAYDDETKPTDVLAGLSNLVVFASNEDDPYIAEDEDDESEKNDYIIKPTDNLITVGHVEDDCSILEVYVYNEADDHYIHHDVMLPSFPLCVEWMNFDPSQNENANFVAVGYMEPLIEVWDVDLVDALEPVFTLGKKKKKKNKNKSNGGSEGHTDAILDLSWNKIIRNVIASASADNTVCLWDMTEGKVVASITSYSDKVQTLEWHPFEAETILTGCYDSTVKIFDCRNTKKTSIEWTLEGQIERVKWNHFNPFCCFASTDKGFVYYLDSRSKVPVWTLNAHFDACTGISLSSQCPGLFITASVDTQMKVWDIEGLQPHFVAEKHLNMGKIFCVESCPDDGFIFAIGGNDRSNNFTVQDVRTIASVRNHFATRPLKIPVLAKSESLPESMDVTETAEQTSS